MNVINNGRKRPKWSIESIPEGLYLKGERDTVFGMQKYLIVVPGKGAMYLHIIFDAGRSAEDALRMDTDRLVIDGEYISADEFRICRVNDHGCINAMYSLTPDLMTRIANAKSVGLALQFSPDAPVFLGFDNLPFEEGAAKLPGLLSVYARGQ